MLTNLYLGSCNTILNNIIMFIILYYIFGIERPGFTNKMYSKYGRRPPLGPNTPASVKCMWPDYTVL